MINLSEKKCFALSSFKVPSLLISFISHSYLTSLPMNRSMMDEISHGACVPICLVLYHKDTLLNPCVFVAQNCS